MQTETVAAGSETGGRIVHTNVTAGQTVRRGDVLVTLDDAAARASLERAQAEQQQAEAAHQEALAQSNPQTQAAGGAIRDARAALTLAQREFIRAQRLAATGDVSRESLDRARAAYRQAQAKLQTADANYASLVNAQLPGARESAQAQLGAARAAARAAAVALRESIVTAPADGVVASFDLHPGDLLAPNQPVALIDTFADPYVYIYASQSDLAHFANGTHLRVISDADAQSYEGVVETHDRTAQFTPQNTETADQRAALVYGVKIRVVDPQHRLLSGTTITIRL